MNQREALLLRALSQSVTEQNKIYLHRLLPTAPGTRVAPASGLSYGAGSGRCLRSPPPPRVNRATHVMTRPLGVGVPLPSPPVTRSRRHFTPTAAATEAARGFRKQTTAEFFKPVLNQDLGHKDSIVLCSPDRGNVKDAGIGLSVLCTERFEKKISSSKKVRRKKMPDQTPNTGSVIDAFRRVKEEKDSVNILENDRACKALDSLYPKVVIQRLLITAGSHNCFLAKKDKTIKSEEGRNKKCLGVTRVPLSCGNSWEQKTDCMDLEDSSSDSDKWVSEADTLKACARNNGTVNNVSPCQNPGLPTQLSCTPTDSECRLSLETLHRERKRKKHIMKQSKPHPVKPFSGTSVSHQGNGRPLRKVPHSCPRETASDDTSQPKQVSKHQGSSPNALRTSSEMATGRRKRRSIPSRCLRSKMCFGQSKQIDFPGKKRHATISMDTHSSNQSKVSGLNDPAFSRSSAKCKNKKSDFVKSILKSTCGDVLQIKEATALPRRDSTFPEEYLNSSDENEKNNCSAVGLSSSYSVRTPGKNNQTSVVDTKENQLQVANSYCFLEKSLPFSQEISTVLPSLHHLTQTKGVKSHLQNASFSQVLDAKKEQDGKIPERHACNKANNIQSRKSFLKTKDTTSEDASDSCLVEGSRKLALSEETDESVPHLLPFKEGCMDSGRMSSRLSGEVKVRSTCTNKSKLNARSIISFDSEDDSLECSLADADDDDDDEVAFVSLQQILSSSPKPQTGMEEFCVDSSSQDTMNPLLNLHLSKPSVVSQVSYVNSLEHLLKEKEESKRVDELERWLQEDMQGKESDSLDGEHEDASGDEDLSEEHRAIIKRFSVVAHAIPDYPPGEDIFDLSTSGKIFNQHNLDLRNFHFIPQNPIERLLLNSGVTQQLSLAISGFLSSAYSCILCPIPILKWLFQMMSVHPDYCVSTQILDRLMEITLKNASISDEQSKPWIPSLADVSTVFVNMGVAFRSLFPLQHLQPNFNERDILSQMQETVGKQQPRGDLTSAGPAFSSLPENNLINVIKFLGFCTTVIQGGYTDQEILLLLLLLFKISLEKQLKRIPLIDFQCLFIKLLISIKDWDTKMPELCLAVSELSSHHHNLLWLVQLVPSWIVCGREVRRRLSLVIISKLLHKKHIEIPDDSDKQMSLLHQFLVYMKPSNLLKKMREGLEQQNASEDHLHTELEQEAYYLIYILLHLVSEASFFDVVNSNQRHLLKLCGALDKHIKCDIREDARLFYRTKVKDLVARIYGKWQDMIQTTWPTQGKLHDFWEPDS
ncbi:SMC5-SMC6 complex localization factor protein 2 isoform X4 [Falco naumanni]|uniref:SMC5-SMC6 complex localization factor protein 2 isoform X4 n=1 Tax=Falco naumanni TaxID=148594 RepID=UPI001ADE9DD3|nr:SMC5-SMC6 complex localization factor protein 2 isoform X4 [Falco naumanni]